MLTKGRVELFKTLLQVVAILCLAVFFAMLLHKAAVDFSALAKQYPGNDFWPAVGRHFIRNLGGG